MHKSLKEKEELAKRIDILAKNITARGPLVKDLFAKLEKDTEAFERIDSLNVVMRNTFDGGVALDCNRYNASKFHEMPIRSIRSLIENGIFARYENDEVWWKSLTIPKMVMLLKCLCNLGISQNPDLRC